MGCLKLDIIEKEGAEKFFPLSSGEFLTKSGSSSKNRYNTYPFGFNGMEADNELKGNGNSYTTQFRQYDPRLARWKSLDPVIHPWESPYAAFANNPIAFADPRGNSSKNRVKKDIKKQQRKYQDQLNEMSDDLDASSKIKVHTVAVDDVINDKLHVAYMFEYSDSKGVTQTGQIGGWVKYDNPRISRKWLLKFTFTIVGGSGTRAEDEIEWKFRKGTKHLTVEQELIDMLDLSRRGPVQKPGHDANQRNNRQRDYGTGGSKRDDQLKHNTFTPDQKPKATDSSEFLGTDGMHKLYFYDNNTYKDSNVSKRTSETKLKPKSWSK